MERFPGSWTLRVFDLLSDDVIDRGGCDHQQRKRQSHQP